MYQITDRAKAILAQALGEAERRQEPVVEPEDVLGAILRENDGVACRAMRQLGVQPAAVTPPDPRGIVEPARQASIRPVAYDRLPPDLLATAAEEATALGHRYIGTEHLLLALAGPRYPGVAALLTGHGLSLPAARLTIGQLLGRQRPEP